MLGLISEWPVIPKPAQIYPILAAIAQFEHEIHYADMDNNFRRRVIWNIKY